MLIKCARIKYASIYYYAAFKLMARSDTTLADPHRPSQTLQIQLFLLPNYFLLIKNTIIVLLNSILILQKQVLKLRKKIFAHQIGQFGVYRN